jgi:hypothetical protein
MPEVFLDLDGVLVDFVKGACKLHGVENPYLNPVNHGKYNMETLIHIDSKIFFDKMGHDFWANLEWLPDGREIIEAILKYVSPEQVTLLTSPIKTLGCTSGKMDWIEKNLPQWKRSFLIGPNKHKIAGPGKLLIDDYDINVDKWSVNGPAIQVPRVMNRLHDMHTLSYVKTKLAEFFDA